MKEISWNDFAQVELRVGKVVEVAEFPEARKPAYKISVDFGDKIGVKRTSAQFKDLYSKEDLLDRQVVGVVNFPVKQIGPMMSEFLLCGFYREDGAVVLAIPEREVPLGAKLG